MRLIISFTSSIFNINHDDTIVFDMIFKNHIKKISMKITEVILHSCLGYFLLNRNLQQNKSCLSKQQIRN